MLKLLSLIRWVWFKIFDVNKPGLSSSNQILIHCHCNFSAHLLLMSVSKTALFSG